MHIHSISAVKSESTRVCAARLEEWSQQLLTGDQFKGMPLDQMADAAECAIAAWMSPRRSRWWKTDLTLPHRRTLVGAIRRVLFEILQDTEAKKKKKEKKKSHVFAYPGGQGRWVGTSPQILLLRNWRQS